MPCIVAFNCLSAFAVAMFAYRYGYVCFKQGFPLCYLYLYTHFSWDHSCSFLRFSCNCAQLSLCPCHIQCFLYDIVAFWFTNFMMSFVFATIGLFSPNYTAVYIIVFKILIFTTAIISFPPTKIHMKRTKWIYLTGRD